ncbi:MAG: AraC family transcriptional regulator [Vallitaleaceae bacterium]|jgi:AraC-like DNA-binding protein|nr:AraC family transcriptional regulator [Vallitaleaceae bacterium]
MQTVIYTEYDNEILAFREHSFGCDVNVHLHDCYEIYIPMCKGVRYYVEGCAFDMSVGDLIITNQQEIHRPFVAGRSRYDRIVIQFHPATIHAFFPDGYNPLSIFENRSAGVSNYFQNILNDYPDYLDLIDSIISERKKQTPKSLTNAKLSLIKLIMFLEEQYQSKPTPTHWVTTQSRIAEVLDHINQNHTNYMDLDSISAHHYMDKYYLSHLFKKHTGFTIGEYIHSKRIQHVKALISNGVGIMDASIESGFEDYSNFYRTFKKYVHMSPKAYKILVSQRQGSGF